MLLYEGIQYQIKIDYEKAFYWHTKAAELGDLYSMLSLADFYQYGNSYVTKDLKKVFEWYKRACDIGHEFALHYLGDCFRDGIGVEVDYQQALHWYEKGAEKGSIYAMFELAECHKNGIGVDIDLEQALFWYNKSAEGGLKRAKKVIDQLKTNGLVFTTIDKDHVEEEDNEDLSLELFNPNDSEIVDKDDIDFEWELEGAEEASFLLFITDDLDALEDLKEDGEPNGSIDPVYEGTDNIVCIDDCDIELDYDTEYYWAVYAITEDDDRYVWSDVYTFQTDSEEEEDEEIYDGQTLNGMKHGSGTLTYSNGTVYKGDFVKDKKHGYGIYTDAKGLIYEGEFHDNGPHGKGKLTYPNGNIYIGDFRNSWISGTGILKCTDGDFYQGEFQMGKFVYGQLTRGNGEIYTGKFNDERARKGFYLIY
jgi:hypothetical protein